MTKLTRASRVYLTAMVVLVLAAVSLRSAALIVDFDIYTGYFDGKSLIKAANICISSGCIFLFTYAIAAKKDTKLVADFSSPATFIPTGIICTSLAIFIINGVSLFVSTGTTLQVLLRPSLSSSFIFAISLGLAALAIVHFALTALVTKRSSSSRAAFGIAAVLFFAIYASCLYFDTTLTINAPNKITDQMAFLFTAIFFLYETRISLEREVWNLYISFGFIAASLCAYSSIPSLIAYFVNDITVSSSISENVVVLSAFIFIISRITLAFFLKEDKENELVTIMREYSEKRDAETTESNERILGLYSDFVQATEGYGGEEENESPALKADDEDLIEIISNEEYDFLDGEGSEEKRNDADAEISNEENAGADDEVAEMSSAVEAESSESSVQEDDGSATV